MAIGGGTKPSLDMKLVDGTLREGVIRLRVGVESNPQKAVARLIRGEEVFVQVYGRIVDDVRRGVEEAMQEGTDAANG